MKRLKVYYKLLERDNMKKLRETKIFGISIRRIFAYFLIYGVIGFIIETIFGVITKGLLESRTSFLYEPICGIYGMGAALMILVLQYCKNDNKKIFLTSFLVGSIMEYLTSFFVEIVLHVKWWDYSDRLLNINGRICLYYSIFWGFLGIFLIKLINPKIDKFIDFIKEKLSKKMLNALIIASITIFTIDFFATWMAIDLFTIRMVEKNDIKVENREEITKKYNKIYGNEKLSHFIYRFWGDKKMIKTFPNIKVQDVDGNIIYLDSFLKEIQPYYFKVFDKKLY